MAKQINTNDTHGCDVVDVHATAIQPFVHLLGWWRWYISLAAGTSLWSFHLIFLSSVTNGLALAGVKTFIKQWFQ